MKLFLVAGEPSGDALGAALMAELKALHPGIRFEGVGGPLMAAEGLESLFPMSDLSVMGLAEVLPRLRHLFRRRDEAAAAALASGAAALVTIDSPDFCLRVAAKVKAARPDLPVIHYVAPSVWAWRPGRARRMARHVDHVLALLPFEPPYMEAAGMGCDFVGHPVAARALPGAGEIAALRASLGLEAGARILCVLPGSRRSEVARLAPVFGAALGLLDGPARDLVPVVVAAPAVAGMVAEAIAGWPAGTRMLDPRGLSAAEAEARKWALMGTSHAALAASGTVSLELAAAGVPMVIGYDASWLTREIIWAMMRIDTVTLVNLVSETRAVPEFLRAGCKPAPIAAALSALAGDGPARAAQLAAMDLTMERLGRGGKPPGLRAAEAVLGVLERR